MHSYLLVLIFLCKSLAFIFIRSTPKGAISSIIGSFQLAFDFEGDCYPPKKGQKNKPKP